MLNYYGAGIPQIPTSSSASSFDITSLLPARIGQDTSGNFALSVSGLAVRTPAGKWVTKDRDENILLDVSLLVIPGIDPMVYRIPTETVRPNDLIVTSDVPLSLLYVLHTEPGQPQEIHGLNPFTGEFVDYRPAEGLFFNFFVLVVSMLDILTA